MEDTPSSQPKDSAHDYPEAEALKPLANSTPIEEHANSTNTTGASGPPTAKHIPHRSYRPSHKATFIGLSVVIAILGVNAVIINFILSRQPTTNLSGPTGQVSISSSVLSQLGVNRSSVGAAGEQLTVDPDAQFRGAMSIAGDVSVGGKVTLNNKIIGTDASLTQLEAGNTSVNQLNVSGNGTASNLSLRNNLLVTGASQLQGPVALNNSLNVSGNVTVGGLLSAGSFSASSLTSNSTLTIDGHIITGGTAPSVGIGGAAIGSNGTVSISGNDTAGTIAINIGTGSSAGTLAKVAFRTQYGNVPRIIITPIGVAGSFYISNPSVAGFNIAVGNSLPTGGYALDYIVEQ